MSLTLIYSIYPITTDLFINIFLFLFVLDHHQTGNANSTNLETDNEIVTCKDNESKKREDLTSLGSDDSGVYKFLF